MLAPRLLSLVRRRRFALPAAALGAVLLLAPAPARAQSAADKATARSLARSGIKLYRDGKYKDSLDRLQRAEALYNAPIHLLYIARCQVKLGKIVEGAETYRRLGRAKLSAHPPTAFTDAKASGAKELSALIPKIPALRVEVQPAKVNDMDVVIDGEHLPPAVVGIDRPADPGKHTVRVTAPGFQPAETTVELQMGQKKPVKLTLKPASGGSAAAPAGAAAAGTPAEPASKGATAAPGKSGGATNPGAKPSKIGFMAGLRLGGTISAGNAFKQPDGTTAVSMKDFAGPGFGGEIHAGVRLWQYFTPQVFVGATALKPHNQELNAGGQGLNSSTTGSYQGGGLGVMVGTPRGKLGGFGELDVSFDTVVQTISKIEAPKLSTDPALANCTLKTTLSGTGVRLGGGMVIPVASFLQLTPLAMVTVEKFNNRTIDAPLTCLAKLAGYGAPASGSHPIQNQALHTTVFLGVGGDFVFGSDKPVK